MKPKRFAFLALQYAVLAVALVATAAVSALVTMRAVLQAQEVMVPSLVGRKVGEATTIAGGQRLQVRVEGRRNDPKVPADTVLMQEPLAGSTMKTGRNVRIWLSLGPRLTAVPDLRGQALRAAQLTLDQAQVPVGRVVQIPDPAPEGTVLLQHPAPGPTRNATEGVSLLVSIGPRPRSYVMPDLIGRASGPIVAALQSAGLQVGAVRPRSYPGVAPGIVLRQVPPAGHRVASGVPIELEVSKGDE